MLIFLTLLALLMGSIRAFGIVGVSLLLTAPVLPWAYLMWIRWLMHKSGAIHEAHSPISDVVFTCGFLWALCLSVLLALIGIGSVYGTLSGVATH